MFNLFSLSSLIRATFARLPEHRNAMGSDLMCAMYSDRTEFDERVKSDCNVSKVKSFDRQLLHTVFILKNLFPLAYISKPTTLTTYKMVKVYILR